VPAAIEFQREWGWDEVQARCHVLVERFISETGLPPAREFGQMLAVVLLPAPDRRDSLQTGGLRLRP
jgi:hypothetical protein